jgi:hypothetical protein
MKIPRKNNKITVDIIFWSAGLFPVLHGDLEVGKTVVGGQLTAVQGPLLVPSGLPCSRRENDVHQRMNANGLLPYDLFS